tara:strand:- start:368 stop:1240 length:873 start_codon:yes stop_codon:yes gene_type:complete
MNFTSSTIKELREKSGAGMMDCKKALNESQGNVDKAIEWLRKKGINTAQKKSSRSALDGLVTIIVKDDIGIIIEINAETDFVARNENFQKFCDELAETCIENKVNNIQDLLTTKFISSEQSVQENLTNLVSKLGENIVIRRLIFVDQANTYCQKYLHNSVNSNSGKIGVLLSYESKENNDNVESFTKNLCMHIAATDPKSLTIEHLDEELVEKERSIYSEQLKSSDKPKEILSKIIDGKIKKFYEEVCLMEQFFVIDNKLRIKEIIANFNKEHNFDFKIKNYVMFKLGQE